MKLFELPGLSGALRQTESDRDSVRSPPLFATSLRFGPEFLRPDYGGRCFAGLPETIAQLLGCAPRAALSDSARALPMQEIVYGGASSAQVVILILVDGFGWRFLERLQSLKPVEAVLKDASVACITAQFPSTTAAHLPTLHSGVPVTESGIYEWFYHEPIMGRIISPLSFNDARSDFEGRGELAKLGFSAHQLGPWNTLYQNLAQRGGVESFVYHSASFAHGDYSLHATRGASLRPIDCVEHGFSLLRSDLSERNAASAPSYHLLYLPEFDGMTHEHGPASERLVRCAERIFAQIAQLKARLGPKTLLLISADHGQTAVDPLTTAYLDKMFPELVQDIAIGSAGLPLVPAGSARDFFLHIKPERRTQARAQLREKLRGIADVYSQDEMTELGLLGRAPSARFLERLGDTVVLPHAGATVWWSEGGKFKMSFLGHHGGLSEDELLIPLISMRA